MIPLNRLRLVTLVAAGVAVTVSASCIPGHGSHERFEPCGSDDDCAADLQCEYGRCRPECAFDSDCPGDGSCVATPDGGRVCVAGSEAAGCSSTDGEFTCPEGLICGPDGRCREPCEDDDDCTPPGVRVCVSGVCIEYGYGDCGDELCVPPETTLACPDDCPALCSDGLCTHGEDARSCPDDCDAVCRDGFCTHDEDALTCPEDCTECGDGLCSGGETILSCPEDCTECGDGLCSSGEDVESCAADCPAVCDDGHCTPPETVLDCPEDCDAVCGDGYCTPPESHGTCATDCLDTCGNMTCDPGETAATCGVDCPAECGDGACTHAETDCTCPVDCFPSCGDGCCTGTETDCTCPADCSPLCGDGCCTGSETDCTCPADCSPLCGDGCCSGSEDYCTCPADCSPLCGDGCCSPSENASTCSGDCPAVCGDDACTHLESAGGCPGDCRDVLDVSAGNQHTCAVLEGGDVRCWGNYTHGRLGCGSAVTESIGDTELPYVVGPVDLGGERAARVFAGGAHTCALTESDHVYCWGQNDQGQLGLARTDAIGDDETPASAGPVDVPSGVVELALGALHTCAVLDTGVVYCWGEGAIGATGYGSTADVGDGETPAARGPVPLGAGEVASSIAAGGSHTCAVLNDGDLRCWGASSMGQLGYGDRIAIGDTEPITTIPPLTFAASVVEATAGDFHTCARIATGAVYCWGEGSSGQLGNASTAGLLSPPGTAVALGGTATGLDAGANHTCATLASGALLCWGFGPPGCLGYDNPDTIGDGELPSTAGAVPVGAGTILTIAAGGYHTCARIGGADPVVRCWGDGYAGMTGYGHTDPIGDGGGRTIISEGDVQVLPP